MSSGNVLAYDTETTGLPDFKARSHDPAQPHLVQLGLVMFDDAGNELSARSIIVRPNGWNIPAEMTAIHGISHERAVDEGIPEEHAAALFIIAQARVSVRVAHNENFDRRIMRIAMVRSGFNHNFIDTIERRRSFCTCTGSTSILKLPPTDRMVLAGMTGFKSPKLAECTSHFFGEELEGAHDAVVDARACGRLYFHLQTLALVSRDQAVTTENEGVTQS